VRHSPRIAQHLLNGPPGQVNRTILAQQTGLAERIIGSTRRECLVIGGEPPDAITRQTPYGEVFRLAPAVQFSDTSGGWNDPILTVRGSCKPEWLPAR
jgi:hypothetical protein